MARTANIPPHTANNSRPSKRVFAASGRATAPMQVVDTSASQLSKRALGSDTATTSSRTAPRRRSQYAAPSASVISTGDGPAAVVPLRAPAKSQNTQVSSAPTKVTSKKSVKTPDTSNATTAKAKPKNTSKQSSKAQKAPKTQNASMPMNLTSKFIVAVIVCIFAVVVLYPTARDYYITVREKDRLAAEYQALVARNEVIQEEIATLNTNEGIEDHARAQFGWVKAGENAMTVTDIGDIADTTSLPDQVIAGSIEAPETWLTKILDVVFFVD